MWTDIAPYEEELKIAGIVAAAVLVFAAGCAVTRWYYTGVVATMKAENAQATAKFQMDARQTEAQLRKKVEVAENESRTREIVLRRDADDARAHASGLRDELAQVRRELSTSTVEACRIRADALADVFGQCVGEYQKLGEKADRHASDVRTLSDAWPTN